MNDLIDRALKPLPTRIYHGTTETVLRAALRQGLRPRGRSGKSNWDHTVGSNKKAVYLTTAYPLHFAGAAADHNERMAIIELDVGMLNPACLAPDEDAIEQAMRGSPHDPLKDKGWDMKRRTVWFRSHAREYRWEGSVRLLGTCAYYGTVPPAAIMRALLLTSDEWAHLVIYGFDPTVSITHYGMLGEMYEHNMRWLFGDEETYRSITTAATGFERKGIIELFNA